MKIKMLIAIIPMTLILQACGGSSDGKITSDNRTTTKLTASKWTCTAQGLKEARYDGSNEAYIHLSAYTTGGKYKVTKNAEGTKATGKTKDGTEFTCTKS